MSKVNSGGIPGEHKKSAVDKLIIAKQGEFFYPGLMMYPVPKDGMLNIYFFKFNEIRKIFFRSMLYNLNDFIGGDVCYFEGDNVCTGRLDAVKEKNAKVSVLISSPPKQSAWKDIGEIFITAKQHEPSGIELP